MGVRTTADEHRDQARDSIDDAVKSLSAIVVDRVFGSTDYSIAELAKLESAFFDLLRIREALR